MYVFLSHDTHSECHEGEIEVMVLFTKADCVFYVWTKTYGERSHIQCVLESGPVYVCCSVL